MNDVALVSKTFGMDLASTAEGRIYVGKAFAMDEKFVEVSLS